MQSRSDAPAAPGSEFSAARPAWTRSWRRIALLGVFLVYLVQTGAAVHQYSSGSAAVAGYLALSAFAVCYIIAATAANPLAAWGPSSNLALPSSWSRSRFWLLYGAMVALYGAESIFARADAYVMCVYIIVLSVAALGGRAAPLVVAFTAEAVIVPALVPSWHTGIDVNALLVLPVMGLAMYAFFNLLAANRAVALARSEVARLAAENERTRIARDLHDLLGHSLTTITIKAGLARRLAAVDPERAAREIGEVEELTRQSLTDIRATLANYRQVTLTGELATARELLRAAGVWAQLPGATEVVDAAHQELFGWVIREGLTNVVRHAHATKCWVTLGPSSVEIVDNGVGGSPICGHGLTGLRERVEAAGGTVIVGPAAPNGWRLDVRLDPRGSEAGRLA